MGSPGYWNLTSRAGARLTEVKPDQKGYTVGVNDEPSPVLSITCHAIVVGEPMDLR